METPPVEMQDFVQQLLADFADCYSSDRALEPLHDNAEYMRLTELRFLLKNVRELLDIQLYQAYSRSETISYDVVAGGVARAAASRSGSIDEGDGGSAPSPSKKAKKASEPGALTSAAESDAIFPSGSGGSAVNPLLKRTMTDRNYLLQRRSLLDAEGARLRDFIACRIELSNRPPRILQLCAKYDFSREERECLHLMCVVQGSTNSHVLNALIEEDYLRRITGFQRLCEMSEVGIEVFCDADRLHIKEGMVLVDEENGTHFNLRTPRTVVQLLYGRRVRPDDLLKVAQTALEEILHEEGSTAGVGADEQGGLGRALSRAGSFATGQKRKMEGLFDEVAGQTINSLAGPRLARSLSGAGCRYGSGRRGAKPGKEALVLDGLSALLGSKGLKGLPQVASPGPSSQSPLTSAALAAATTTAAQLPGETDDDEGLEDEEGSDEEEAAGVPLVPAASQPRPPISDDASALPYPADSQLEYLEECFQIVQLMVRGLTARMKDDMKKEGARSHWDSGGDVKHGRRELQAKLRLHEGRVQRRVDLTRRAGQPLPRLEVIAERLGLDSFEKKMIMLLIGKTVSPVVKTLMDTLDTQRVVDEVITVGQALAILCQDFQTQVANRRYFYRSGRLMTNGIISLIRSRWHQGSGDLTDNRIVLDRRVLDWAVGLDSEINELVEGSDLYEPKANLAQVVLPHGYLDALLKQCLCYDAFRKYRNDIGMQDTLSYGNSLVVMLCGKSGTGKTMTVNAIAKELGKKVLLVDFTSLTGKRPEQGGGDMEADLRGLFREAQLSNAVLFFDECETVFKSRSHGGDRLLNSLLTEIERHEGIVFLATNRPHELDEAMHRRITCVLEFRQPDVSMRRSIWQNLLGQNLQGQNPSGEGRSGLVLADDVDTAALASRFDLAGGFIKNAVISALLSAISRSATAPVVTQEDLVGGCKLQMRGALSIRSFEDKVVASSGLASLHLSPLLLDAAETIVRFERARATVFGSWTAGGAAGSEAGASGQKGCICGLAGPLGGGKRTFMKALAFELGRTIKMVHVAEIVSGSTGLSETMQAVQTLLQDARLADALIVIDGFEHVMEEGSGQEGGGWKLHLLLSRLMGLLHSYPGLVVLVCHVDNPQNAILQRDFAVQLFCFLRFTTAPADVRGKLWRKLMPPGAPCAPDVNHVELGRRFELNPSSIRAAIVRAASEAAMREGAGALSITQKDLMVAGDVEVAKLRNGNFELISKLFS